MNVQSAYVTVTAQVSYNYPEDPDDESASALAAFGPDDGALDGWDNNATVTVTVIGTDAVTQTYSQLSSYTQPEPVPTGLAQVLHDALSLLQYQGTYETVTQEVSQWSLGAVLNLAGGRPEWSSMNALLQEIIHDLDNGLTTLKFGPAGHLTLQGLMEQLRANRTRATSSHIKERQSGQPGDTPAVNGPGQGGDTNSTTPPQPTHYPWIDFIDQQDDDNGNALTFASLLGYGQASFVGDDYPGEIDHASPLEKLEISVGNDGSGWNSADSGGLGDLTYGATSLYNGLSIITGHEDYTSNQILIGAASNEGAGGGSVQILPGTPMVYLSPNLSPGGDTESTAFLKITNGEILINGGDGYANTLAEGSIIIDDPTPGYQIAIDVFDPSIILTGADGSEVSLDGGFLVAAEGCEAELNSGGLTIENPSTSSSIQLVLESIPSGTTATWVSGVIEGYAFFGFPYGPP